MRNKFQKIVLLLILIGLFFYCNRHKKEDIVKTVKTYYHHYFNKNEQSSDNMIEIKKNDSIENKEFNNQNDKTDEKKELEANKKKDEQEETKKEIETEEIYSSISFEEKEEEPKKDEEESKKVALTFDDGPSKYTLELLEILEENNVKATFFVIGSSVERHSSIIKEMVNDGHQIESHSLNHSNFTEITTEEMIKELEKTKEILSKHGVIPTLVRPPYGRINESVKQNIGYPLILWSLDTRDWDHRNSEEGTRIIIEI